MQAITPRFRLLAMMLALVAVSIGRARGDTFRYATISDGGNSTLGALDLTTGRFTAVATLSQLIVGMTAGPDNTLYAGALFSGNVYTIGPTGTLTPFGSVTAPVSPGGSQLGFWGLADAGPNGLYGLNPSGAPSGTETATSLDRIAADGNSLSVVGPLPLYAGSGSLTFGPDGALYTESSNGGTSPLLLYRVDPASGTVTAIGTGLGTYRDDPLTLFAAGGQLYGIDTAMPSGAGPIDIYTVDTTTGKATATGIAVTGVSSGFTLDVVAGIASVVPEPGTLTLAGISFALCAGYAWRRRKQS